MMLASRIRPAGGVYADALTSRKSVASSDSYTLTVASVLLRNGMMV
jgi:hypothetical protein